ncbi:MAG: Protein of unknown function (DUF2877) [Idiomarinaceae bacterium HL-53]|nr:MAG: Protein of unknown function (DUF2877) [Idiomarinaceae bacterium HL-53]CUS48536.1 hypothetical protein Ga0003345_1494 [Idiomarinaceae bacterium HL-53]
MKALLIATAATLSVSAPAASANVLNDLAQEVRAEVQLTNLVSKHIDVAEIRASLRNSALELFTIVANNTDEKAETKTREVAEVVADSSDEQAPE